MSDDIGRFKASVVWLILSGKPEEALEQLSNFYHVGVPKIKVGLPKGHRKNVLGCYTVRDRTISILNSDTLKAPLVILHEFYHHLRTRSDKIHRGTERNATDFARSFIESFNAVAASGSGILQH
jgi:hypothetical protein